MITGGTVEEESDDYKGRFRYTKDVCALSWWEPLRLLQEGSISDIHLVRRRESFVKVRYKDKRDVMSLAKRQLPWKKGQSIDSEEDVYVLKSIHKDHVGNDLVLDEMRQEINIMSKLHHPNICRLVEAYERRRHIYLVMEFCSGGNLASRAPMEEGHAATVCRKILSAVKYLHDRGVAHRDIKLENVMLDGNGEVKLIDFGLATVYLSDRYQNMTDKVGTLYSMAPEVLDGNYDKRCDLWSVGVVAYVLLCGEQPFWGPHTRSAWKERRLIMMDRIRKCQYAPMTYRSWIDVSDAAKEFVRSLLQLDPDDRPTPTEALHSPWIATSGKEEYTRANSLVLDEEGKEKLDRLTATRRRLWAFLSTTLSEDEIEGLRAYIEAEDESGDGTIGPQALHALLSEWSSSFSCAKLGCCEGGGLDAIFDGCDADAKINYVDFFVDVLVGRGRNTVDDLAKVLDTLDVQGTRRIKLEDAKMAVDELLPSELSASIWDNLESDDDGMVETSALLSDVTERYAGRHRESIRSGRSF